MKVVFLVDCTLMDRPREIVSFYQYQLAVTRFVMFGDIKRNSNKKGCHVFYIVFRTPFDNEMTHKVHWVQVN